jgi:hypothetical protein
LDVKKRFSEEQIIGFLREAEPFDKHTYLAHGAKATSS